jgi:hypothetical protein
VCVCVCVCVCGTRAEREAVVLRDLEKWVEKWAVDWQQYVGTGVQSIASICKVVTNTT